MYCKDRIQYMTEKPGRQERKRSKLPKRTFNEEEQIERKRSESIIRAQEMTGDRPKRRRPVPKVIETPNEKTLPKILEDLRKATGWVPAENDEVAKAGESEPKTTLPSPEAEVEGSWKQPELKGLKFGGEE